MLATLCSWRDDGHVYPIGALSREVVVSVANVSNQRMRDRAAALLALHRHGADVPYRRYVTTRKPSDG
jgi:hypothetical protein